MFFALFLYFLATVPVVIVIGRLFGYFWTSYHSFDNKLFLIES